MCVYILIYFKIIIQLYCFDQVFIIPNIYFLVSLRIVYSFSFLSVTILGILVIYLPSSAFTFLEC